MSKHTIIVTEGDEQSTHPHKKAMCEAYGWNYRDYRNMNGLPKKIGRYKLSKSENGISIPCKKLRNFLDKKFTVERSSLDGVMTFDLVLRGLKEFTIYINEKTHVIIRVKNLRGETIVIDDATRKLLTVKTFLHANNNQ